MSRCPVSEKHARLNAENTATAADAKSNAETFASNAAASRAMAASNAAPWKCGTNSDAALVTTVVKIASVNSAHSSFAKPNTRHRYCAGVPSWLAFVPLSPRTPPSAVSRFFRQKHRMQQSKSHVLHLNPPNRRPLLPAFRRRPHMSQTCPTTRSWNCSSCAWKSGRNTPVRTVHALTHFRKYADCAFTARMETPNRSTVLRSSFGLGS